MTGAMEPRPGSSVQQGPAPVPHLLPPVSEATPPGSSANQPAVVPLFPWRWRQGAATAAERCYTGGGGGVQEEEEQVVGEGRGGTDVGKERRDEVAGVETGRQKNGRVFFDERFMCGHGGTQSSWCGRVCRHTRHVFVLLIRGCLKVIWKCRTSIVKASAPLVLRLTFTCL